MTPNPTKTNRVVTEDAQPDLLPIEPTKPPELEIARNRLSDAQDAMLDAEYAFAASDNPDNTKLTIAMDEIRMALTDVKRLEAAELAKLKPEAAREPGEK